MRSERTGNSPRGRRGNRAPGARPAAPGQPQSGAGRGGQRRPRAAEGGGGRGAPKGGGQRGGAARPPRAGGQGGGFQRRNSSTSGWTIVRPWRPPRDDADEPIIDEEDDSQPNWDAISSDRSPRRPAGGGGNAARPAGGRSRARPPAWPGGGTQGGRRNPNDRTRTARGNNAPAQRQRRPAAGPRQPQKPERGGTSRLGVWMPPPESATNDEE